MFKVGDKVKIVKFPERSCVGYVCEVIAEGCTLDFCCRIKQLSTNWECLMLPDEIEPLLKVGQQMLFSFMEQ